MKQKKTSVTYGIIGFGNIAETRIAKEGFRIDKSRFPETGKARLLGASSRTGRRMEAGKHVIAEKPITTSAADAAELQKEARNRGLSLSVNHMMQYNGYNLTARRLIGEETLGRVNDISLHLEFLLGVTEEEKAQWRVADPGEVGGLVGNVTGAGFEVYGEKGVLRSFGTLGQLSGHEDEPDSVSNIYAAVIDRHAESVLSGAPLDGEEGVWNMKLIEACFESARVGGPKVAVD
jgi:predicted dehydrogenase